MNVSKRLSPWLVAIVLSATACFEGIRPAPVAPTSGADERPVEVSASPQPSPEEQPPPSEGEPVSTNEEESAMQGADSPAEDPNPLGMYASYCNTKQCELQIYFGRPMIEAADLEKAPLPKVTFDPPQAGELRWKNATTVQFTPQEGAFNWGHSITTIVEDAEALDGTALKRPWVHNFTVPFFEVGNKMALWPVQPGQPRFVGIMRGTEGALMGAGPLLLLYDQPVKASHLASWIKLRSEDGQELPAKIFHPKSATRFGFQKLDTAHLVAVKPEKAPQNEDIIQVELPTWLKPGKRSIHTSEVEVATKFEVTTARLPKKWDATRAPLSFDWDLEFATPVNAEAFKKALRITPKPRSVWTWNYYGNSVTVHGVYDPGTKYTIRVDKNLQDMLENDLTKAPSLSFRTRDVRPRASLGHKAVIYPRQGTKVPLKTTNVRNIQAETFALGGPKAYISQLERGGSCDAPDNRGPLLNQRRLRARPQKNKAVVVDVPVQTQSKNGYICVVTRGDGFGSESSGSVINRAVVHLTNLGVTTKVGESETLVWVTQQNTAKQVHRARVRLLDPQGKQVALAHTNSEGVARLSIDGKKALKIRHYVVVETARDTAVTKLDPRRLSNAWQFGMKGSVSGHRALSATIFTDRGVYRPGEKVHAKFMVRADDNLHPSKGEEVSFELLDPKGQEVLKRTVVLDKFGSGDIEIPLKDGARLGRYSVWLRGSDRSKHASFRVEEYRVPTFEVKVRNLSKKWDSKTPTRVRVSAKYLHGGKLAGRSLHYRIVRSASAVKARGLKGFVFSDPRISPGLEVLADRTVKLDGEGQATLEFSAAHRPEQGPMRYSIEASVTDLDQQTYAGRLSKTVHAAKLYVGVKSPSRTIVEAGKEITVPVIAVNTDGQPVSGKRIRVELEQVQHFTAKRMGASSGNLVNSQGTTTVRRCQLRSGKTAKQCKFTLPKAGRYRVVARLLPYPNERLSAAFNLTAYGRTGTQWRRFQHERITVISDKKTYQAGDTAKLVVESPFPSARGLVTIERDGVVEERIFRIQGDTPTIRLPIKDSWAPNVYVSVVLLSPRRHHKKDATGTETGAPSFRIGYTQLKVRPKKAVAKVDVQVSKPVAGPGEEIDLSLRVRDGRGRGVSGQATVWLVDEAVLGLTNYRTPNPLADFLAPRTLGVRTASNYLDLLWARKARNEALYPAGDGEEYELEEEAEGGRNPMDVRTLFESTAYWNPSVKVSADGLAQVRIKLPDNLTKWRAIAVFTSSGRLSGSSQASLQTKKPLMVQPSLPRFAYPGDTFTGGATIVNESEQSGPTTLRISGSGFELDARSEISTPNLRSGASTRVPLPIVAGRSKSIELELAASMLEHRDAVRRSIPILEPGNKRVKVETVAVTQDGTLQLDVPAERLEGSATLEIVVSTTVLSKLREAVGYLMGYPYGCIEQTTSRAYPLVVLEELLPDMGVQVNKTELKKFTEAGIKRILSFQTPSGGLSYWPGGRTPHAFGTGFGLTALIAAKKRGFDVPDEALARLSDYLIAVLNNGTITEEMPHGGLADADTRAFLVMQLGRLGRHQPGMISRLWESRDKMTSFGLSFLSIAAREASGSEALEDPILDAIQSTLKVANNEAFVESKSKGGWSMDSALRTHAASLLAFAGSENRTEVEHKLLTGLLNRSRHGQWGNTQENVFGIMAVAESVATTSSPNGTGLNITLNDRTIPVSKMESLSPRVKRISIPLDQMGVEEGQRKRLQLRLRHALDKPVHFTARLEYKEKLTPATRAPISKGMSIERRLLTLDGKKLDPESIQLGDVVKVRLRVHTEATRNYIAIDDKLPAGFEALNAALANNQTVTSSPMTRAGKRGLNYLSHHELRDERVVFFVDKMPKGTLEFEYIVRATTAGTFTRPAAMVEAMYDPTAIASTAIDTVKIQ